ncbi:MAG: hypothetical protein U1F43_11350 [Myxococcota bacterium]
MGGFEPLDILSALTLLVDQIVAGKAEVVNAFPRASRAMATSARRP